MTNRKQRRAIGKAPDGPPGKVIKMPVVAEMPNISGTDECCRNCSAVALRGRVDAVRKRNGLLPMALDEVLCLEKPGGGVSMKTWGWCRRWYGYRDAFREKAKP